MKYLFGILLALFVINWVVAITFLPNIEVSLPAAFGVFLAGGALFLAALRYRGII